MVIGGIGRAVLGCLGLKWPPALTPSPLEQSPFSCTWKPCSPGLRPLTRACTSTWSPAWLNVTVPAVAWPVVGASVAWRWRWGPWGRPIHLAARGEQRCGGHGGDEWWSSCVSLRRSGGGGC